MRPPFNRFEPIRILCHAKKAPCDAAFGDFLHFTQYCE